MNKHDRRRIGALITALKLAEDKAETALLYLSVQDQPTDELMAVGLAREHIELALEALGAGKGGEEQRS
ncbi:hypothetical protein [Gorillibacterium sp. sgz5001074]|uniref:hypothetical protein n=1 Tax=Gorillibacterium sp. sgz5001074 TaxID=3446695 RepID=UPI003F67C17D